MQEVCDNKMLYCAKCTLLTRSSNSCFHTTVFYGEVGGGHIERAWLLLLIIVYDSDVIRRQIQYHRGVIEYY